MRIAEITPSTNSPMINTQIGIKMLDKSLDVEKNMGDEIVKMMEKSVNPDLGSNFDVKI